MQSRTNTALALDPEQKRQLDRIADKLQVSRSELMNQAIKQCLDNPNAIGLTITNAISRNKAHEPGHAPNANKVKTSVMIEIDYMEALERMAASAYLSRNDLMHLIALGLTLGTLNVTVH